MISAGRVVVSHAGSRAGWLAAALLTVVLLVPVLTAGHASAQEVMRSFEAHYQLNADGSLSVVELITWDFGTEPHHGIFRDLVDHRACEDFKPAPGSTAQQPLHPCPDGYDRQWPVDLESVEVARSGNTTPAYSFVQYDTSEVGDGIRVKIGDPDSTITGAWIYRLTYSIRGALDGYSDHNELYWNALGTWPVAVEKVSVEVTGLPQTGLRTTCYLGPPGAKLPCNPARPGTGSVAFGATRTLYPGEQLSIVAGWDRGQVNAAPPLVEDRLSPDDFFTLDAVEWGGVAVVAAGSLALVIALWWRHGRDRRYKTLFYLTSDPSEGTKPLFARTDVVVEFLPPDGLRPAQMGLILDERADTRDVTATVIDLAVRGYLHITEIPKDGLFGHKDWHLTKETPASPEELLPYEEAVHSGLFASGEGVNLSDLKTKFARDLATAEELLYADAIKKKWFPDNPQTMRAAWLAGGFGMAVLGVLFSIATGWFFARALIGVPVVPGGLLLAVLSRAMARRTATGSEALRRVLGFRLYVATAETRRQEFNEKQNIFARYLPYAIVFGCVDKWARAFSGIDDPVATGTAGWYTGLGAFQVMAFSSSLQGFAGSVSSTIASTPSSGGSGFGGGFSGGGFSGGGGGGGGGGSW